MGDFSAALVVDDSDARAGATCWGRRGISTLLCCRLAAGGVKDRNASWLFLALQSCWPILTLLKRRNCTARSLPSYTVFYYMGGPAGPNDEPNRILSCE